jgi:hypothetical protein
MSNGDDLLLEVKRLVTEGDIPNDASIRLVLAAQIETLRETKKTRDEVSTIKTSVSVLKNWLKLTWGVLILIAGSFISHAISLAR